MTTVYGVRSPCVPTTCTKTADEPGTGGWFGSGTPADFVGICSHTRAMRLWHGRGGPGAPPCAGPAAGPDSRGLGRVAAHIPPSRGAPATVRRNTPATPAWAPPRPCRPPTGGACWPTCARRSSAGCTPPKPGSGACLQSLPVAPRRRHLAGEALLGIARETGLALGTARKHARAETFPARSPHGPGILDPCLAHLERRLAEGCGNGLALWRELRKQGFLGGARQARRWLIERRTVPAKTGPHAQRAREAGEARPPAARSEKPACGGPGRRPAQQQPPASSRTGRLQPSSAWRAGSRRRCALAASLAGARACSATAIATGATGLEADGAAARAALARPWSSGQAEGQINRTKLLKRQSHGRAGFDLLRRQVLRAA